MPKLKDRIAWVNGASEGDFGDTSADPTRVGPHVLALLALTPIVIAAGLLYPWIREYFPEENGFLFGVVAVLVTASYGHEAAHMVVGRVVSTVRAAHRCRRVRKWPRPARATGGFLLSAVATVQPLSRRRYVAVLLAPSMLAFACAASAGVAAARNQPGWLVPDLMALVLALTQLNDWVAIRAVSRTCPHAQITEYRNGVAWKWKCVPPKSLRPPCEGGTGLP